MVDAVIPVDILDGIRRIFAYLNETGVVSGGAGCCSCLPCCSGGPGEVDETAVVPAAHPTKPVPSTLAVAVAGGGGGGAPTASQGAHGTVVVAAGAPGAGGDVEFEFGELLSLLANLLSSVVSQDEVSGLAQRLMSEIGLDAIKAKALEAKDAFFASMSRLVSGFFAKLVQTSDLGDTVLASLLPDEVQVLLKTLLSGMKAGSGHDGSSDDSSASGDGSEPGDDDGDGGDGESLFESSELRTLNVAAVLARSIKARLVGALENIRDPQAYIKRAVKTIHGFLQHLVSKRGTFSGEAFKSLFVDLVDWVAIGSDVVSDVFVSLEHTLVNDSIPHLADRLAAPVRKRADQLRVALAADPSATLMETSMAAGTGIETQARTVIRTTRSKIKGVIDSIGSLLAFVLRASSSNGLEERLVLTVCDVDANGRLVLKTGLDLGDGPLVDDGGVPGWSGSRDGGGTPAGASSSSDINDHDGYSASDAGGPATGGEPGGTGDGTGGGVGGARRDYDYDSADNRGYPDDRDHDGVDDGGDDRDHLGVDNGGYDRDHDGVDDGGYDRDYDGVGERNHDGGHDGGHDGVDDRDYNGVGDREFSDDRDYPDDRDYDGSHNGGDYDDRGSFEGNGSGEGSLYDSREDDGGSRGRSGDAGPHDNYPVDGPRGAPGPGGPTSGHLPTSGIPDVLGVFGAELPLLKRLVGLANRDRRGLVDEVNVKLAATLVAGLDGIGLNQGRATLDDARGTVQSMWSQLTAAVLAQTFGLEAMVSDASLTRRRSILSALEALDNTLRQVVDFLQTSIRLAWRRLTEFAVGDGRLENVGAGIHRRVSDLIEQVVGVGASFRRKVRKMGRAMEFGRKVDSIAAAARLMGSSMGDATDNMVGAAVSAHAEALRLKDTVSELSANRVAFMDTAKTFLADVAKHIFGDVLPRLLGDVFDNMLLPGAAGGIQKCRRVLFSLLERLQDLLAGSPFYILSKLIHVVKTKLGEGTPLRWCGHVAGFWFCCCCCCV